MTIDKKPLHNPKFWIMTAISFCCLWLVIYYVYEILEAHYLIKIVLGLFIVALYYIAFTVTTDIIYDGVEINEKHKNNSKD